MESFFFNRKDILEILDKRIKDLKEGFRQNIAIIGDELLGKTCLIRNFLSNFKDKSILPVYIEVRPEDFSDFKKRFVARLLFNLLKESNLALEENLDYLLEKINKLFPKIYLKIKEILMTQDKKRDLEVFLSLLSLPKIIKEETNLFSLIIFDEFCFFEEFNIKRIYQEWAKVIMLEKDTMYILISSEKSKARNVLSSELSLLFGNFEVIEISPFNQNLSYGFIEKIILPIESDHQIKEYLINLTGGAPFYLKLICKAIKDKARIKNLGVVSQDLFVEPILDLSLEQEGV